MLPGEAAEQNGDLAALLCRKSALNRTMEMGSMIQPGDLAQTDAFRLQALLDFLVELNIHQLRRHHIPPTSAMPIWLINADGSPLRTVEEGRVRKTQVGREPPCIGVAELNFIDISFTCRQGGRRFAPRGALRSDSRGAGFEQDVLSPTSPFLGKRPGQRS